MNQLYKNLHLYTDKTDSITIKFIALDFVFLGYHSTNSF